MSNQLAERANKVAAKVYTDLVEKVASKEVTVPKNYLVVNALKSAFTKLQEVKDKNGRAALEVCTPLSVKNSIERMIKRGLDCDLDQYYFTVFGNQLNGMISVWGKVKISKDRCGVKEVYGDVIYSNDEYKPKRKRGKIVDLEHDYNRMSDRGEWLGAYAVAEMEDGSFRFIEQTKEEIMNSWRMGKFGEYQLPFNADGTMKEGWEIGDKGKIKQGFTHANFFDDMVKKVPIGKLCMQLIRSTGDERLINELDEAVVEKAEMKLADKTENEANSQELDFEPEIVSPEQEIEVVGNGESEEVELSNENEKVVSDEQKNKEDDAVLELFGNGN